MPVVSVSLTEKNLEVIDRLQEIFGLKGRSEAVRACLRSAEDEIREREGMTGDVEGVLIVVHDSHDSRGLDNIRHLHMDLIGTQIHSHLRNDKCLEVFIVRGESRRIRDMINLFRGSEDLEYVKFVQS
ncbi:MAG TPA: CopG family ribbon-helix-helix protein [Euryarchaeota archaeon]|nr:MAG: nickel-responsive regulator 1 [Thermoplasmatales archaeon ex4484_6]RLF65796.1 MAG: nickel-responsive regulator 1 [Thermoplasmata archaeon]HHD15204.1 CopG family ribbon-helix-helix protein [Euryarchaeota archaeon]